MKETKEDSLDDIVKRMNLADKLDLEKLGYVVDAEGNVALPLTKSLADRIKKLFSQGNYDYDKIDESRRAFLSTSAKLLVSLPVAINSGIGLVNNNDGNDEESSTRRDVERYRSVVRISEVTSSFAENLDTLRIADKVAFYTNAPIIEEDGGIVPTSNDRFFHNRAHELLGFTDKPSFLVIHTDGGDDVRSTLQSLDQRNIHCQFAVGEVGGRAISIQTVPLKHDRVNLSGTVSGGEINPYQANLQFWSALNIEIQGTPNNVEAEFIDKTVELCLKIMSTYNLRISQLIGHMEVPNNGKPDPGRSILKEIRTRVLLRLIEEGLYQLVDVVPDTKGKLEELFSIASEASGPAELDQSGRAKCWLPSIEDFCDWVRIQSFLDENIALRQDLEMFTTGNMYVVPVVNNNFENLEEIYMGYPGSFVDWLTTSPRVLSEPEFESGNPRYIAQFIYRLRNIILGNADIIGHDLPFTINTIRNLARLFVSSDPLRNRGTELSEALISITENIGNTQEALQILSNNYTSRFNQDFLDRV